MLGFYGDPGGLNSVPQARTAGALPTEPSPQPHSSHFLNETGPWKPSALPKVVVKDEKLAIILDRQIDRERATDK